MSRTRTNIELDDEHLTTIMNRFNVHSKTEAVALALRHLADQPMEREEALTMAGANAIGDVPDDTPAPSNLISFLDALDKEHGPSDPVDFAEFRGLFS